MKLIVNPHKIEISKTLVNEKEIKVTEIEFEFSDEIPDSYVKDVYFTLKGETYQVPNIQNNKCDIPYEVLKEKGQVEIGVVAYLLDNDEYVKRFNPSPVYISTLDGSLKDEYENYEEITPSDKEQIEQELLNITTQMNNLDIEAEKEEHTTTITITKKDGTSYDVEVLDGEKGDKGDKGEPGAIKMLIVAELPATGSDDTIYLVPLENPDIQGNNYAEYVYINGEWELLGKIGVQVDLTDYVKNTDYATTSKGGVFKSGGFGLLINQYGQLYAEAITYSNYANTTDWTFIGKKTLENVIAGKDLTTKAYVDGLVGDIGTALDLINGESVGD